MRWTASRRRKCLHLIRHGLRRVTFPYGKALVPVNTENFLAERCSLTISDCTFYLLQIFKGNCSQI